MYRQASVSEGYLVDGRHRPRLALLQAAFALIVVLRQRAIQTTAARRSQKPCPLLAFRRMVSGVGPDVPDERFDPGHVALIVEAKPAEHRVKLIVAQRLDHGSGLEGARLLDRLRPDLDDGVTVEREPFGLVAFRAEPGDDRCRRLDAYGRRP